MACKSSENCQSAALNISNAISFYQTAIDDMRKNNDNSQILHIIRAIEAEIDDLNSIKNSISSLATDIDSAVIAKKQKEQKEANAKKQKALEENVSNSKDSSVDKSVAKKESTASKVFSSFSSVIK